jgi:hypothetical protein
MNKAVGVGIAVIIIVAIAGIAYSLSSTESNDGNLPVVGDLNLDESVLLDEEIVTEELDEEIVSEELDEEIVSEELEQTGKDFSVELTEDIGIKSP